jgi:hypothetical protein
MTVRVMTLMPNAVGPYLPIVSVLFRGLHHDVGEARLGCADPANDFRASTFDFALKVARAPTMRSAPHWQ